MKWTATALPRRDLLRLLAGVAAPLAVSSLLGCRGEPHGSRQITVTVAAAASLRGVCPALVAAFSAEHRHVRLRVAYGASGDLRKRVRDGAPVDVVMLANAKPVDELVASGDVRSGSRQVVASNELVLITPTAHPTRLTFESLDELPADEKLAVGNPGSVPAGEYAREALTTLGLWQRLQDRLVLGGDVSAVLAYARRGEVAAAIVYATEIRGIDDVSLLQRASGPWAPRPEVVVGLLRDAAHAEQGRAFLEFVASESGQAIFAEHGFGPA